MFQANDSALINPFQSFHSASLPSVSVVKPPEPLVCGLTPELGWSSVFCLVTDITLAIKVSSSSEIAEHQGCCVGGGCQSSEPILIPESSFGEVQQDIALLPGPHEPRHDGRGISISDSQLVFQPTVSVCSHSLSSKLARNKNEIQIYVSEPGQ